MSNAPRLLIDSDIGTHLDHASDSQLDDEISGVLKYLEEIVVRRKLRYLNAGKPVAASTTSEALRKLSGKLNRESVAADIGSAAKDAEEVPVGQVAVMFIPVHWTDVFRLFWLITRSGR